MPDPTPMTEPEDHAPHPVTESHRHRSLDVVRGFALLGILAPNLLSFAWPAYAMYGSAWVDQAAVLVDPNATPHAEANALGHEITAVFFFGKMMFLFALLFGAGVVLYAKKFEGRALTEGWRLWYRRMGWLLAIGLVHAVVFWYGDILVWYALSGLGALWWVRGWSPRRQLVIGSVVYVSGMLALATLFWLWSAGMAAGTEGESTSAAETLGPMMSSEIDAYTRTYLTALRSRLFTLIPMYLVVVPFGYFWMCTGIMMGGMALTRLGVLTGERPARFYARLGFGGLALGLASTAALFYGLGHAAPERAGPLFTSFGQLAGIPTSLGYAALLILILKLGVLRPLTTALAAVGRTALSNYLLQTLIATTVFYPHGFGLYGRVQYPELWLVMLGVWIVNIAFSLLWLRFFRFGPAEWLWRSLTYGERQPMRRARPATEPNTNPRA